MTRQPRWIADSDYPATEAMALARSAIGGFSPAAMFDLSDRGFGSVFQQVVSCVISIRTRDEESLPASLRLLEIAPDATSVANLDESEIERLIAPSTFREQKAARIREIARIALRDHNGELPCDGDVLSALPGVGPKCRNLALGVACGTPVVSVDIHVHRVTNRWGLVAAKTPELTWEALESVLPDDQKVEINRVLVPFGKHVCTGVRPRCSTCPVLPICAQIGVENPR